MAETDRDEKVAQAYRALGAEEPPRALDEAILAAAQRRPARWRVPLSVAAVVVLAVGVTLRMLPQGPDAESVALAPQVIDTPRPAAPPAEQVGKLEHSAPRAPAPRRAEPSAGRTEARVPASGGGLGKKNAELAQAAESRQRADTQAARQAAAPASGVAGAPPELAADSVRDSAPASTMDQAGARPPVAAEAAPRALAAAKPAEPATPEAWLERIAELKKQGREREAEESLAEFKKRYPDYKIPEALTR